MKKLIILIVGMMNFHLLLSQSNFDKGYKEYNNYHYDIAVTYFTKSINEKQNVMNSYLFRGMSYLFLNVVDKSKLDFDEAYKIDPNNPKIYGFYGKYYSVINQYGRALENYNIALDLNPKEYTLYSERAGAKAMLGMLSEAMVDAEIAVKNEPNDYNVYLNRGYIKMSMDKYAEAVDDFTKSIKIKPSHKAYGNRGTSYALLKKYDLALSDFDQALKYNADDPLILYYQAEVLLALGQKDKACKNLLKSKQLGNNVIDDVIKKAKCYE